ncbi:PTS glucitol/sorbitol transporter subunit IIA [Carnobacterium gallinarum]|uniref:PTS glucitol/sorbitol transporter subunit IIA n=1 Tax=Carnobacterium gallinarum TaxID=2749 RepID=UPI001FE00605|nr:PTS glucitol/sorbitol transporter subunit IIA [Carnobacterium gallinarum]
MEKKEGYYMLIGTVTSIGPQAISQKDPIIILFGEGATEDIREVSVIQEFENAEQADLKVGQTILFDEEAYTIEAVGVLATDNLNSIGHITLSFSEVPAEDMLGNGIYLTPHRLPDFKLGMKISYQND